MLEFFLSLFKAWKVLYGFAKKTFLGLENVFEEALKFVLTKVYECWDPGYQSKCSLNPSLLWFLHIVASCFASILVIRKTAEVSLLDLLTLFLFSFAGGGPGGGMHSEWCG